MAVWKDHLNLFKASNLFELFLVTFGNFITHFYDLLNNI